MDEYDFGADTVKIIQSIIDLMPVNIIFFRTSPMESFI